MEALLSLYVVMITKHSGRCSPPNNKQNTTMSNEQQKPPSLPQPQQPINVTITGGYTFGKFCLHFSMVVGTCALLVMAGCVTLVGGCANASAYLAGEVSDAAGKSLDNTIESMEKERLDNLKRIEEINKELIKASNIPEPITEAEWAAFRKDLNRFTEVGGEPITDEEWAAVREEYTSNFIPEYGVTAFRKSIVMTIEELELKQSNEKDHKE